MSEVYFPEWNYTDAWFDSDEFKRLQSWLHNQFKPSLDKAFSDANIPTPELKFWIYNNDDFDSDAFKSFQGWSSNFGKEMEKIGAKFGISPSFSSWMYGDDDYDSEEFKSIERWINTYLIKSTEIFFSLLENSKSNTSSPAPEIDPQLIVTRKELETIENNIELLSDRINYSKRSISTKIYILMLINVLFFGVNLYYIFIKNS